MPDPLRRLRHLREMEGAQLLGCESIPLGVFAMPDPLPRIRHLREMEGAQLLGCESSPFRGLCASRMVERAGIEPATSALQRRRSPS